MSGTLAYAFHAWYMAYDHDVMILWFAVFALATARATRLARADEILSRPRRWLITRWGTTSKMAYFITCPWCLSIYFGTMSAVAFVALSHVSWWLIIPAALAFSYIAGLLARIEQD
jgi:hypothetical protein